MAGTFDPVDPSLILCIPAFSCSFSTINYFTHMLSITTQNSAIARSRFSDICQTYLFSDSRPLIAIHITIGRYELSRFLKTPFLRAQMSQVTGEHQCKILYKFRCFTICSTIYTHHIPPDICNLTPHRTKSKSKATEDYGMIVNNGT